MSYEKTNWQTGDTITAEKLNHAEQGIYDNSTSGSGVLMVNAVYDEQTGVTTLDKTWQEIHDADIAVVSSEYTDMETDESGVLKSFVKIIEYSPDDGYIVNILGGSVITTYYTDSSDGYPSTDSGGGSDPPAT